MSKGRCKKIKFMKIVDQDDQLKDAGLYEENLSKQEKDDLLKCLEDSYATAENEKKNRTCNGKSSKKIALINSDKNSNENCDDTRTKYDEEIQIIKDKEPQVDSVDVCNAEEKLSKGGLHENKLQVVIEIDSLRINNVKEIDETSSLSTSPVKSPVLVNKVFNGQTEKQAANEANLFDDSTVEDLDSKGASSTEKPQLQVNPTIKIMYNPLHMKRKLERERSQLAFIKSISETRIQCRLRILSLLNATQCEVIKYQKQLPNNMRWNPAITTLRKKVRSHKTLENLILEVSKSEEVDALQKECVPKSVKQLTKEDECEVVFANFHNKDSNKQKTDTNNESSICPPTTHSISKDDILMDSDSDDDIFLGRNFSRRNNTNAITGPSSSTGACSNYLSNEKNASNQLPSISNDHSGTSHQISSQPISETASDQHSTPMEDPKDIATPNSTQDYDIYLEEPLQLSIKNSPKEKMHIAMIYIECPLCLSQFPQDKIERHASDCEGKVPEKRIRLSRHNSDGS